MVNEQEREILKQYSYKATSNLVYENTARRPREQSAIIPLQKDALPGKMGDKVFHARPEPSKRQKRNEVQNLPEAALLADANVVDVAEEHDLHDEKAYIPTTKISQRAYEGLLAFVMSKLGDQPREILRGAAGEIIATMKDDSVIPAEKRRMSNEILGVELPEDEYGRLMTITREIEDFGKDDVEFSDDGVPVLFEEEEESKEADDEVAPEVVDVEEEDAVVGEQAKLGAADEGDADIRLDLLKIDAYWIQRRLGEFYKDAHECRRVAEDVFSMLAGEEDDRACENRLLSLLEFDKFEFIAMLIENRFEITSCVKLARSEGDDRLKVEDELRNSEGGLKILRKLKINSAPETKKKRKRERRGVSFVDEALSGEQMRPDFPLRRLDIENLAFQKGGRLMSVRDCALPEGSEHVEKKDYEEWHIPAVRASSKSEERLVKVQEMPEWAQSAFRSTHQLNRMQSAVHHCAFETDENILLCAPTGAGKTNVAVLTVLRAIANAMGEGGLEDLDRESFKVVYVAPMKALVAEVVENLGKRLADLGMVVRELTGDVGLSGREIGETQVIVTTPEKWDIITRKSGQKAFTSLVRLLIIDEIHLLHDERGPVLESIVARTTRGIESLTLSTRIVGLSATLPNYKDVATFLRVKPRKGLFYFDQTHRPCPLQQCFLGITAKNALKRYQLMNELTYDRVKLQLKSSNQAIVFVHSRKETTSTCRYLIEKAIEDEVIDQFLKPRSASYEVIQAELASVNSRDLASVLEHGLATHHAGISRNDRQLVEALFEAGHVKVLVSTATLAWGVNLPAHAVIIKGTQVYSPQHGRWMELSSMDVMQMMGRAGRPQFDTFGEGYIITTKKDVLYYLSLLNNQLPIESQYVSRLVDMVNAEVAMGAVTSVNEGSLWLCFTYLYVRMIKNPALYGIAADEHHSDSKLERRRAELIHAAATELDRAGLVKYNKRTGEIEGTDLGKVAADFYVSHQTMSTYIEHMKLSTTDIDLYRIFSLSGEFRHMSVREEEKLELARLAERVPIPIKEPLEESTAKVNVLLQAYISNLSLDGLALKADMVYVKQSAGRLARALLQVAVQMKWAELFLRCLKLCKSVTTRQWTVMTPLRQFSTFLSQDLIHKIERKDIPFDQYYDLSVAELGELFRDPKLGRTIHRLVHSLPRLDMEAQVRPLTRSTIGIDLTLTPDFRYDRKVHGSGEAFWITVEDGDSENLLYSELFFLHPSLASEEHALSFTVPLLQPQPHHYFVRCVSDRWIVPETTLPIMFRNLLLPEKFAAHTKLLEVRPLSIDRAFDSGDVHRGDDALIEDMAYREALMQTKTYFRSRSDHFSSLQTQVFPVLFESDVNSVVATLPDIERELCGELCLARLFCRKPTATAVWIAGSGERAVDRVHEALSRGIGKQLNLKMGKLLSDRSEELALLRSSGALIVTTPQRWDMFSRKWRQRREGKILAKIGLVILDGIQYLGYEGCTGSALEIVGSRMRYIAADATENDLDPVRIVALSDPTANAKDVGHWLGAPPAAVFSFHPKAVAKDLKVEVIPALIRGRLHSQSMSLSRPVFSAIRRHFGKSKHGVVVFVSSRKMARSLALEIIGAAAEGGDPDKFIQQRDSAAKELFKQIQTRSLRDCLEFGVGYIHGDLPESDRCTMETLFADGGAEVLVSTSGYAWETNALSARLVVIAGTAREQEGGFATKRAEYNHSDLLRMMCVTRDVANQQKRVCVIITEPALHDHYRRHILEPIPVESQLRSTLSDHLNAEVVSGVVESKQDAVDYLTWTFFYRRLPKNPNYYGMKGLSNVEISNYLSEVVETALGDLESSKCIAAEGEEDIALGALNLGNIAAHYYVRHATIELFASSVTPKTKLRGLLDIVSMASEFNDIPVRVGDAEIFETLAANVPVGLQHEDDMPSYSSPRVKAHLLLQAQLSRMKLPAELSQDQAKILVISVRLLRAMVDVISTAGWLKPVLAAVELSQMIVQGLWDRDQAVMQLPFVTREITEILREKYEVSDVFGFLDMEDEDRSQVLKGLSYKQMADMSAACDRFPNLEDFVVEKVEEVVEDGVSVTKVVVALSRAQEEEDEKVEQVPVVSAPLFPERKEEGWWVIIGDAKTNTLYTLKHVGLKESAMVKMEFVSPAEVGKHRLSIYVLSDSYVDCDQDDEFEIGVSVSGAEMDVESPQQS